MNPRANKSSEPHPYFPSGDWEGFYNDPRGGGKKGDMTMTLEFAGGHITGSGSDPVGTYDWTGTYDTKAETCALTKRYAGAHAVEYSGYADENGIWGKWNIRKLAAGEFHIWPKKSEAREGAEEERKTSKQATREWSFAVKMAYCFLLALLLHHVTFAQNQPHPKAVMTVADTIKGLSDRYEPDTTRFADTFFSETEKVAVDVTVDSLGIVSAAAYQRKGSTTNRKEYVRKALEIVRRTKFKPGNTESEGTVIVTFRIHN